MKTSLASLLGILFSQTLVLPTAFAEDSSKTDISAYIDSYYSYNYNRPALTPSPVSGTTDPNYAPYRGLPNGGTHLRNFDNQHNQFILNLAEISYKHTLKELSARLDLDFGDTAEITHNTGKGVDDVGKHVGQAFLSYTPSRFERLTLNIGKMATHMGAEVTKAKDNWQYSRSFLFALAIPYWHLGICANYILVQNALNTSLFVYNGWNSTYENNNGKTLGFQLNWTPNKKVNVTYNAIGGPEREANDGDWRVVHEMNATLVFNRSFSLAADAAFGREKNAVSVSGKNSDAKWSAVQVGSKISFNEATYLSARIEKYWDSDGFTSGLAQTLSEGTLTASWKPADPLETRLELRRDRSTQAPFLKAKDPANQQTTVTLGFLCSL